MSKNFQPLLLSKRKRYVRFYSNLKQIAPQLSFPNSPAFASVLSTYLFIKSYQSQPPERERSPICGLGAKVGCERLSEHSTCRDESHK